MSLFAGTSLLVGIDVLRYEEDFRRLHGKRIGLLTHPAALSGALSDPTAATYPRRTTLEVLAAAPGVELVALFGPEHGFTGAAQDLESVGETYRDPLTGAAVYSLYGDTIESLRPAADQLRGLDVLVIDLVDVGSRYYTFQATMLYCLEAAADVGLPVLILDRPNPISEYPWHPDFERHGPGIEGPTVRPGFESFVGCHPICTVHGMTMGELARLYQAERVPSVELSIIRCQGVNCKSGDWPGPSPSPNMPSWKTAILYPGMCLIEGTNLSEGRGTTRPFEYIGFPGVNPYEITDRLRAEEIGGVEFFPASFRPTFQKHAGLTCGGVFIEIADHSDFRPVRLGLAVLCAFRELLGERFRWRTETYEFVSHIPAIDLLFGSDRERLAIDAGQPWREIAAAWEPEEEAFRQRREPFLLYRD